MVQAKTSDFQPLPLKILNVLSLLAGASLLVAVSWEILLGDPRHYSTDYLLLQGIVCVVFLADFFARMWMADHSWRFFFRNLYFFLLSVPYLNIVDWMGIELSHAEAMLMAPPKKVHKCFSHMKTLELEIVQGFFFYPHYAFRYIFVKLDFANSVAFFKAFEKAINMYHTSLFFNCLTIPISGVKK